MGYYIRTEKISWNDGVRNEEVLGIYYKRRKGRWMGHILLSNHLPKHVTGGKTWGSIEVTGR